MPIYHSVTELIGRTPLLELCNYERNHDLKAVLLAKLECMNPAGSAKDRVAANLDIFCGKLQMGGGRTAGPTQDMNDVLTFMLEKNQTYTVKYANEAGKMKEVEVKLGEQPVELKLYMK